MNERVGVLALSAGLALSCGLVADDETASGAGSGGSSAGAAGTAGASGAGAHGAETGGYGGSAGGAPCPAAPGPQLVRVGSFCIDATEVTNADYAVFLAAKPSPSSQIAGCAWNPSFAPGDSATGKIDKWCKEAWDPVGRADYPVVCVDWCDAFAYCAWAGKRLCGRVGSGGLTKKGMADPSQSQWHHACTAGGTRVYPYGNTYDPARCNGYAYGVNAVLPVGAAAGCVGAGPTHDMSGNVDEWEDACDLSPTGLPDEVECGARGGSFWSDDIRLRCSEGPLGPSPMPRAMLDPVLGFRCCAD